MRRFGERLSTGLRRDAAAYRLPSSSIELPRT